MALLKIALITSHYKAHNADWVCLTGENWPSLKRQRQRKTSSLLICEPHVTLLLLVAASFFFPFHAAVLFSDTCLEITLSFWCLVTSHKPFSAISKKPQNCGDTAFLESLSCPNTAQHCHLVWLSVKKI